MDDVDRWHGLHRVVKVTGSGGHGSGYAIHSSLVLCAGHVVGDNRDVTVSIPEIGDVPGSVLRVFRDVALVNVLMRRGGPWPDVNQVAQRFGRPDRDQPITCIAMGYPAFQDYDGQRPPFTARGGIQPGTYVEDGLYSLALHGVPPDVEEFQARGRWPWSGFSGAVVLAEQTRHIVGVVRAQSARFSASRLNVVPISTVLEDPGFRGIFGIPDTPTDEDIEILVRHEHLSLIDMRVSPTYRPGLQEWSDTSVLLPEFRAVTFVGRDRELDRLTDWCDSEPLTSIAVVTGRGGAGKSRLVYELCRQLGARWASGLLEPMDLSFVDICRETVAIVDYIDETGRGDFVAELIERFGHRKRGPRLRVLVLARDPFELWSGRLTSRRLPPRVKLENIPVIELGHGKLPLSARREHARKAMRDLAYHLHCDQVTPPHVTEDDYANPLNIHIACLLALRREELGGSVDLATHDRLVDTLLSREIRRWKGRLPPQLTLDEDEIVETVTLVALTQASVTDLSCLISGFSRLFRRESSSVQARVVRWLQQTVAGPDGTAPWPDRFTERLRARLTGSSVEELVAEADAFQHSRLARSAPHRNGVGRRNPSDASVLGSQAERPAAGLGYSGRTERLLYGGDEPIPSRHLDLDGEWLEPQIHGALAQLARLPQLLVACAYDGTLAPLAEDPAEAAPLPEAVAALRSLAGLPQTAVAVISGRALRDLTALSRLPAEVRLVGSHGSEFDVGFAAHLEPSLVELHNELLHDLELVASDHPGVKLDVKPAGAAIHLRAAGESVRESIEDLLKTGPMRWPGIHTIVGKESIELSVIPINKGSAIEALRRQMSAGAVLFLGDDVTDENAFRTLSGKDVGIKVGTGSSIAEYRVDDPLQAVRVLAVLLETRRNWLFGERAVPIERHSMLADGNTVALVTPDARISWLCHPRADSAAIFADLLGGAPAGHFIVAPQRGGHPLGQRYRPGTMTVETRWSGLTVTDWLDGDHLLRRLSGHVTAVVEFSPRPEFGQVPVRLQELGDGLLVLGTSDHFCLYAKGLEWDVVNDGGTDVARAIVDLSKMGGEVLLDLRLRSRDLTPHAMTAPERLDLAEHPWREWCQSLYLPSVERELVMRSALTIKGLCHVEGGGVLAAATTSLPETLGGIRNWDYRFCWLRDGAMAVKALVDLGSLSEAEAFLRWVLRCVDLTRGHPERLNPLYTVDGHELGPEAVIETLPGYAGSRPVRVGNAANKQLHLGIYGPIADVLMAVAEKRGKVKDDEWRVLEAMVHAVAQRWHEPDHGLWEARLPPRHHVYSKVMCWMTVDRALKVLTKHTNGTSPEWEELRDRIAANVLEHGWHPGTNAYTVAYGSPEMDASSLWIGLSGLLADDDPRFLATVLTVESELRSGPTVYRYHWDDGMPGKEGGFHVCTAWLIEAYLRTGRRADAEELFEQLLAKAGPTGLLPEQYDPDIERALGNHPHALAHTSVIRVAQLLSL